MPRFTRMQNEHSTQEVKLESENQVQETRLENQQRIEEIPPWKTTRSMQHCFWNFRAWLLKPSTGRAIAQNFSGFAETNRSTLQQLRDRNRLGTSATSRLATALKLEEPRLRNRASQAALLANG